MRAFFIIIAASILFTSCEDKIEVDHVEGSVKYVVDGRITTECGKHVVTLSTSDKVESIGQTPRVVDATVSINSDKGEVMNLIHIGNGVYETMDDVSAVIGNSYWVEVILSNGSVLKSVPEKVIAVNPIDSVYSIPVDEYTFVNGPPREIDDADSGYYVFVESEFDFVYDSYKWHSYLNDSLLNGPEQILVTDLLFLNEVDFNFLGQEGDTVVFEQLTISDRYDAYNFNLFITEEDAGSPFGTPPALPDGNMFKEGDEDEIVLGYFYASDIAKATLVVGEAGKKPTDIVLTCP